MSIISVDNIQPIGSGTSVTVNSAATLVLNNLNVTGVSTFAGNLNVSGANITLGDSSDGSSDDVLSFGASGDLKIFHSADQSRIVESGPSVLKIMGSDIRLSNSGNTADYIQCNDGTNVRLFYNNNVKFETTDTGVKVTDAILEIADTTCLIDLMETSATNHRIRNGNGNFHIQKLSDDKNTTINQLVIDGGTGETALHHSGTKKLGTKSTGVSVSGVLEFENGHGTYSTNSNSTWQTLFTFSNANNNGFSMECAVAENNYSTIYKVGGTAMWNSCYFTSDHAGDSQHAHSSDIEFRVLNDSGTKRLQFKAVSYTTTRYLTVISLWVKSGSVTWA